MACTSSGTPVLISASLGFGIRIILKTLLSACTSCKLLISVCLHEFLSDAITVLNAPAEIEISGQVTWAYSTPTYTKHVSLLACSSAFLCLPLSAHP